MKEKIFRILFTLVLVVSSSLLSLWPMASPVRAATITSTAAGGVWGTGSTWVGGVAPVAGDTVIIATTGTNSVTGSAGGTSYTCAGLTINSGAILTMNRPFTVNGPTSITGTVNWGSTSGTSRAMTFNDPVTLNSGAVWNEVATGNGANDTFTFANNFTNNATTFNGVATGVHTFSGTGMTISGSTTTSIPTVTFTGNYTNSGTLTVGTLLTVTGAAIRLTNNGTITATAALSGTGGVTQGTTGILNIGGTSGITTLTATAVGNTVNYTGAAQTMKAVTYHHLTLSGSGAKTLTGVTTINGNLTLSGTATATTAATLSVGGNVTIGAGTTLDVSTSNYGLNVGGNWSNGGAFTQRSGTVTLNGTGAQTMTGATTFYNLTLNNSSGLNISNNETINNILTLTAGNITTGSNTVIIGTSGTVARTSGYVVGNLQKAVSTGSNVSRTFEVGTASAYNPVTVTFASVTVAGNLTAKATSGDHPSIGTSSLDSNKSVNAYWSLTNSGITFTNYSATFTFTAGDIDSGANTANFIIGNFNNPNWTYPTVGTRTSTTTQATGITSFGDFAVAEAKTYALAVSISGTTTICQGISTTLTASASGGNPPYTYLWSTGATTPSIDVTVARTYSVTATDSSNATASANATVTVNPAPVVTFSGNPNICGTGSTTLTANVSGNNPPYSYDWSPSTAAGSSNGNTYTATGAGTVAVTVTDNLGCKGRAKTIVSVKSPPTVTISGPTSICEGNSTTLTANPLGGTPPYTYLWSTGANTPSINVSTAGTYSVTVTDSASCTGVIVSDTNTTVTSGNVQGATYPYSAPYAWVHGSWWSSLTGYTFDWSTGHTSTAAQWIWESYRPVHPVDGDIVYFQRSFTITGTPTGATVYITCDNGYEVSINGHLLGSAQLLTGWGPGHLTDPYVPPSGWQTVETWTVPADWLVGGTNTLNITGVNEQSDGGTVDGNPGGVIYELVYQSISDCGCTATDSKTVIVNPAPEANASSNSPVAVGATILLTGGPNGMNSYSWTGPGGWTSNEPSPSRPNATIAMSGTYTLTVTDANTCQDDASVVVTVTAAPTVAIEIYTDPACSIPAASMTPQITYYARVSIASSSNLSYLQTVQVTLFYNDGSHPDAPTSGNTQSCAILTCTVGTPPTWISDFGSPPSPTTTWQLVNDSCSQPANLNVQTGDWIFAFMPGKVATESINPAHWDAQGKATNKSSQTGELYIRNKAMNWYGEITISPPLLVDWGEVPLGLKFEDAPNFKTVSIKYIANGDYYEDIESSATWSGDGQTVGLDVTGINNPAPPGMFALKADNTIVYGDAIVVSTEPKHINASGSLTSEAGVPVNTNGLWLSIGETDIAPVTYSGAIYYQISDR